MNHRFNDAQWAQNYAETVNERRPERLEVFAHVADHLAELANNAPTVVELAPGPGMLAEVLLSAQPQLTYIGIDYSAPFIQIARDKLAPFDQRITLHQADLVKDDWPSLLSSPVHAVVSNMAIHDLGSEAAVTANVEIVALHDRIFNYPEWRGNDDDDVKIILNLIKILLTRG